MGLSQRLKNRFHLSETKSKVFANVFWAVFGKCVNLSGALIVGIVVARYLGPEQYGLMNYVISYVAIFQVLADFGLDNIQIREEARDLAKRDSLLGTTFVLKLLFATIAVILITITSYIFEANADTFLYILIYSFSVILNTTWVARNHFTAIVWNEYIVKTEISRTIIGVAVKVILLLNDASLIWFIFSLIFDSVLLASGYLYSYSKRVDRIGKWVFDKELAKYMLSQSFPLLLSGAAIIIYNRIDQIMIGNMLDKSFVGIYSVAVRFVEVLIFIPTIIAQTVSPILVRIKKEDETRYQHMSELFVNITVWLCIILAGLVSVIAYPLVLFTFGESYIYAATILSVMSFKVVGDALSQTSGQLIIIEGIQKYASIRNVIGCVVCVVFNLVLINMYGIMGAALVSVLTILSSGVLANYIIPSYRSIFKKQIVSIVFGWKDIIHIKQLIQK